jgi:hypothetical protein
MKIKMCTGLCLYHSGSEKMRGFGCFAAFYYLQLLLEGERATSYLTKTDKK